MESMIEKNTQIPKDGFKYYYCSWISGNSKMQDWSQAGVYIPLAVGLIPGFVYWCVITAMRKHK